MDSKAFFPFKASPTLVLPCSAAAFIAAIFSAVILVNPLATASNKPLAFAASIRLFPPDSIPAAIPAATPEAISPCEGISSPKLSKYKKKRFAKIIDSFLDIHASKKLSA